MRIALVVLLICSVGSVAHATPPVAGKAPSAKRIRRFKAQVILVRGLKTPAATSKRVVKTKATRKPAPRRVVVNRRSRRVVVGSLAHIGAGLTVRRVATRRVVAVKSTPSKGLARVHVVRLRRIAARLPGLVPPIVAGPKGVRIAARGRNLAKHGADLYIAPYAMAKLERQVFLLNSMGVAHQGISPRNIVVTPSGELRLAGGWKQAKEGGNIATDQKGLDSVRAFLRVQLGMGG